MTSDFLPKLFVFDVESVGLRGEGFAFGYVVTTTRGVRLEEGGYYCDHVHFDGSQDDRDWVDANVNLQDLTVVGSRRELYQAFQDTWLRWNDTAFLIADVPWPVEAHFLLQALPANINPYPLLDVASMISAAGWNPLGTYDRRSDELPVHNPLYDSRQSARILFEALNSTDCIRCVETALRAAL